jgi:hypothetical protein
VEKFMAENIKVSPTPIQRNKLDVAMELINYHTSRKNVAAEELEVLFAKYYALVTLCEHKSIEELQNLLGEELLGKVGRYSYNGSY